MTRLLLLALACFALLATPAAAHRSLAGCVGGGLGFELTRDRTAVRNGDEITYTVRVANDDVGACDVTSAAVTLQLPARDGTATGTTVTLPDQTYPAGTVTARTVPYVVDVEPGVAAIAVRANATYTLHDRTADLAGTAQRVSARPPRSRRSHSPSPPARARASPRST